MVILYFLYIFLFSIKDLNKQKIWWRKFGIRSNKIREIICWADYKISATLFNIDELFEIIWPHCVGDVLPQISSEAPKPCESLLE